MSAPHIQLFLAHDRAAELLREAERSRLRRAALGTPQGRENTGRFGLRNGLRLPRSLTPRSAG